MRELVDVHLVAVLEGLVGPVAVLFEHQGVFAVETLDVLRNDLLQVRTLSRAHGAHAADRGP